MWRPDPTPSAARSGDPDVVVPTMARRADRLGWWSLVLAVITSTALAAGRLLDVRWLAAPVDRSHPIMLNGALGLFAFSGAAIVLRRWGAIDHVRIAVQVVGTVIALVGLATLFEHLSGIRLGIDQLVRPDAWSGHANPGRPAPQAAFALAAFGIALATPTEWVRSRDALVVAGTVAGLLGLAGHLLGVEELVVLGGTYGLPSETGLIIVLGGVGFALTAPTSGTILAPIVSDTPGGALLRRLMAFALLLPIGAGVLDAALHASGIGDHHGTGWILTSVGVTVTVAMGWRVAMTVDDLSQRVAAQRSRLETLIRSLPDDVRRFDVFGTEQVLTAMEGRLLDDAARARIEGVAARALDGASAREAVTLERGRALTHLDVIATPIRAADGAVTGAITVTRDVTELHAMQQRYRELFDSIPEGLYELGGDGSILVANDPLAQMLGFADAADLLARVSHAQPLWVDTHERDEILRQIRAGTTSGIIDARLRRADGEVITVELSYRVVTSPSGAPIGLRGTVRDVSEERAASARLAEVQERYRLAFENGPLGRVVLDVAGEPARFLDVNPALAELLGYGVEELRSLDPGSLIHPEDLSMEAAALQRCLDGDAQTITYDTRRRHRSGEWIPVGFTGALLRDEMGRPRYAMATVEDLRPRVQATDALMAATALAERRARQSAALNELSAAVLSATDLDDLHTVAARLLTRVLGVEIVTVCELTDGRWHLTGYVGLDPEWLALRTIHVPNDSDVAEVARSLTTRVVPDWRSECDLRLVPLLHAHGVRSTVTANVGQAGTTTITVASTAPRSYDREEVTLVESVGRLLGVARVNDDTRRELARSQQTLAALIDNAPAAVYLFDTEGRFMIANREMARIAGAPDGELVGRTRREVLAYDAAAAAQQEAHDAEVLATGSPQTYEESAPGSDGARTYLSVKFPLLDDRGAAFGIGGISTDITPIKDLESENQRAWNEMLRRIARAVEYRDEETGAHIDRMSAYCELLADQLGLGGERAASIRAAATLHDAGKIAIPDAILLKPGPLTARERQVVQQHCDVGYHLLRGTGAEVLDLAATIAWTHHERWDGSGYPRGLRREEAPLEARIAAVADVFDALTSDRVYRRAVSVDAALAVLRDGSGAAFDPAVVGALLARADDAVAILRRYADRPARESRSGLQARYGSMLEQTSTR